MSELKLKVQERKDKSTSEVYYEGVVNICGLQSTKLTKKDGTTRFSKKSSVSQSAKSLAERMSLSFEDVTSCQAVKKVVQKKAKSSSGCCGNSGTCSTAPWVAN